MKKTYQLRCIAPDGAFQTESGYRDETYTEIQHAWERSNDMGSRWCFYPIHVVTAGKTIRAVPHGMPAEWIVRRLSTLCKAIAADEQHACDYANGLTPFCIFPA